NPRVVVDQLRYRRRERRVAAGWRAKLLQTDDVVRGQHVAEGSQRNIGNLRELCSGLTGGKRRAIEAAAREPEPELIDRERRDVPGMVPHHAVRARQGLADISRRESAAAVRKRCGG